MTYFKDAVIPREAAGSCVRAGHDAPDRPGDSEGSGSKAAFSHSADHAFEQFGRVFHYNHSNACYERRIKVMSTSTVIKIMVDFL